MAGHMGNKNCTKTAVKVKIFLSLFFFFVYDVWLVCFSKIKVFALG